MLNACSHSEDPEHDISGEMIAAYTVQIIQESSIIWENIVNRFVNSLLVHSITTSNTTGKYDHMLSANNASYRSSQVSAKLEKKNG